MISGSNTRVGLTRAGLGDEPDEPERYYPSGIRNYVRILAADDFQAAANAVLAQRLGLKKVFVLAQEGFPAVANAFRAAAAKLGVAIAGTAVWSPEDAGYPEIVRRVRRARVDGVFLTGNLSGGAIGC